MNADRIGVHTHFDCTNEGLKLRFNAVLSVSVAVLLSHLFLAISAPFSIYFSLTLVTLSLCPVFFILLTHSLISVSGWVTHESLFSPRPVKCGGEILLL